MERIELVEVQEKYAIDIWDFRQEIVECDAENEDQFAGCLSLDASKSAEDGATFGTRKRLCKGNASLEYTECKSNGN